MLRGALQELKVGNPDVLSVDVGPVIDAEALQAIASHIEAMRDADFKISQAPAPALEQEGFFIRPTMIEIDKVDVLKSEVFGPVLHVLRYKRQDLDRVIDAINATGYGLTFGVHTRLDETIAHVTEKVRAGNIYVNRNIVGAVVGVQPFGGEGLSGTGPKAGGPLYLRRLLACSPDGLPDWCRVGEAPISLQGPTGEENLYELRPRGAVLCVSATAEGAALQLEACRQTGNKPVFLDSEASRTFIDAARVEAPRDASAAPRLVPAEYVQEGDYDAVLFEGDSDALKDMSRLIAARPGPIISVEGLSSDEIAQGHGYRLERLMREVSCSINTAAAGGNASLMMVG
jgi:RHH-type proline utilization regulon transcriptional repressor/proline dehydrogenase/delta 1-pyrroline-5-carboxylate dehydrogenase